MTRPLLRVSCSPLPVPLFFSLFFPVLLRFFRGTFFTGLSGLRVRSSWRDKQSHARDSRRTFA